MSALSENLFDSGERKTLAELQAADLPRCTPEDISVAFTVNADVPEADRPAAEAAQARAMEALRVHLRAFAKPGPCLQCGAKLGGNRDDFLGAFLGTFTWGIAHGEGKCGRCGYPARGIHFVKVDEDGGELELPYILQYHPSDLSERPRGSR